MSDPDYKYQPWSEARRQAASDRMRTHLGAKPGHRLVYGVDVPQIFWADVEPAARRFRREHSLKATRLFTLSLVASLNKAHPKLKKSPPQTGREGRLAGFLTGGRLR